MNLPKNLYANDKQKLYVPQEANFIVSNNAIVNRSYDFYIQ